MNEHFFIFGLIIDIIVLVLLFITFIKDYGNEPDDFDEVHIDKVKPILYLGIVGFIGFILIIISPFIK